MHKRSTQRTRSLMTEQVDRINHARGAKETRGLKLPCLRTRSLLTESTETVSSIDKRTLAKLSFCQAIPRASEVVVAEAAEVVNVSMSTSSLHAIRKADHAAEEEEECLDSNKSKKACLTGKGMKEMQTVSLIGKCRAMIKGVSLTLPATSSKMPIPPICKVVEKQTPSARAIRPNMAEVELLSSFWATKTR